MIGSEIPGWAGTLPRVVRETSRVSTTPRYAFDDVYAANVAFVWRVLRGMGVTEALIDDAAQDVFEGMTAPEIAAVTATPLNTVYTRLRRAREELSHALADRDRSRR